MTLLEIDRRAAAASTASRRAGAAGPGRVAAAAGRAAAGVHAPLPARLLAAASASASGSPGRWRSHPQLVVCDEPVSALDVSIQAQILNLLQDLQQELGLTYLFVAHDLSVVEHISDRVAVMYVGKLVEVADTEELFVQPAPPVHRGAALGRAEAESEAAAPLGRGQRHRTARPARTAHRAGKRIVLRGEVADPSNPPPGCYFHPRCPYAIDVCKTESPRPARSSCPGTLGELPPRRGAATGRRPLLRLTFAPVRSVSSYVTPGC